MVVVKQKQERETLRQNQQKYVQAVATAVAGTLAIAVLISDGNREKKTLDRLSLDGPPRDLDSSCSHPYTHLYRAPLMCSWRDDRMLSERSMNI